jgi:glyceraldehyde 3-phosphate dehydrogenase
VPDGSVVDLIVEVGKDVTAEEVNAAMKAAANTERMKNVLLYSDFKWVSSDIVGNPYSSIFDPEYTRVIGNRIVKVLSWYDNEWGYSNRVVDLIRLFQKM